MLQTVVSIVVVVVVVVILRPCGHAQLAFLPSFVPRAKPDGWHGARGSPQ